MAKHRRDDVPQSEPARRPSAKVFGRTDARRDSGRARIVGRDLRHEPVRDATSADRAKRANGQLVTAINTKPAAAPAAATQQVLTLKRSTR